MRIRATALRTLANTLSLFGEFGLDLAAAADDDDGWRDEEEDAEASSARLRDVSSASGDLMPSCLCMLRRMRRSALLLFFYQVSKIPYSKR